jgi:two-component system, response regulator PdtaR
MAPEARKLRVPLMEWKLLANQSTPPSDSARSGRQADIAQQSPRVLVVEDEALVALDIESVLRASGFVVVDVVDTQDEAVAQARRLSPDVIVMDITLRQGNGIAAARAIGRRAPVIFVSGNTDPKTLAEARAIEPAAFLSKPFASQELVRLVTEALKSKRGD